MPIESGMRTTFAAAWGTAVLLAAMLLSLPALAERVVPRDTVVSGVVIRAEATSQSAQLGSLSPGESLPYVDSVPRWHQVRLEGGQVGFVSKRWTEVVPDPVLDSGALPFAVHFIDVGTSEVIIDGGDSTRVLNAYAERTELIDGPIELVVVTHGDTDHWRGLRRLLGFDRVVDEPLNVLEYWDPGYDRDCNPPTSGGRQNYLQFVQDMQAHVPAGGFLRPLADHHAPADADTTAAPQPFSLPSVPGVTFTVLHSDESPTQGSCSYQINNASIVLKVEVGGATFLFTGDANGKRRDEGSPGTPLHVEQALLELEGNHPGTLRADVLKVSHHGSETANTQAFIDAVDPDFAVISASTRHHLPRGTVLERLDDGERVILRTDADRQNDTDHIVCTRIDGELECNFADVFTN